MKIASKIKINYENNDKSDILFVQLNNKFNISRINLKDYSIAFIIFKYIIWYYQIIFIFINLHD